MARRGGEGPPDLRPVPSLADRLHRLPRVFPDPDPRTVITVVVPARDEEARLPALVDALAAQRTAAGGPWPEGHVEVLVLLNNCSDGSAEALGAAARRHPALTVRTASVALPAPEAHVGRARQWLFDAAYARLAGRPGGLVLTTDADTRPAPDWVAATVAEAEAGADLVGGRVLLMPEERAALDPAVRRLFLLDVGYRRALERLGALYAPDASDPYPRHHQHYGASLAVTARAYGRAGGMPLVTTSEDVALVRAVRAAGGRVRHSPRVRAYTSARSVGRAHGGLADAFRGWAEHVREGRPVWVESADAAERRLAAPALGRASVAPPATPPPCSRAPSERVLQSLRERIAHVEALAPTLRHRRARALCAPCHA